MSQITLVALDIRSTHNVGAFFRTCDGFGADLVLVGITPRPSGKENDERLPHIRKKMDAAIAKTALGAEKTVSWRYFENIAQTIHQLKLEGNAIVAIEQATNSIPIMSLDSSTDTAIIMGPEVTGIPASVLDMCDKIYEIPMLGHKESFNVSVAAGIALYQAATNMLK